MLANAKMLLVQFEYKQFCLKLYTEGSVYGSSLRASRVDHKLNVETLTQ